jgi:hypothetical protein
LVPPIGERTDAGAPARVGRSFERRRGKQHAPGLHCPKVLLRTPLFV